MKPILLDLLEDNQDVPHWLERQLVGLRLRALIDQLKLLVGPAESLTLEEVCGPELEFVLKRGLTALSGSQIRKLLAHPDLLLDLQERVFLDGSAYWNEVPREDAHIDTVAAHLPIIKQRIQSEAEKATEMQPSIALTDNQPSPTIPVRPRSAIWPRRQVFIAAGTLAASLLLIISWRMMLPAKPAWGFSKSDLATVNLKDTSYLAFLEARAGDWFNKTPANDKELDKRLSEFILGCDKLSRVPHQQLTNPQDRTWLISRCSFWKSQLVQIRSNLRAKPSGFSEYQGEANQVIRDIQQELKDRASTLG